MARLRPASIVMSLSATTVAPCKVVSRPLAVCRLPAEMLVLTAWVSMLAFAWLADFLLLAIATAVASAANVAAATALPRAVPLLRLCAACISCVVRSVVVRLMSWPADRLIASSERSCAASRSMSFPRQHNALATQAAREDVRGAGAVEGAGTALLEQLL
jgi:hypothetical protein